MERQFPIVELSLFGDLNAFCWRQRCLEPNVLLIAQKLDLEYAFVEKIGRRPPGVWM